MNPTRFNAKVDNARLIDLLRQGFNQAACAEVFDCSEKTISKHVCDLRNAGVDLPQPTCSHPRPHKHPPKPSYVMAFTRHAAAPETAKVKLAATPTAETRLRAVAPAFAGSVQTFLGTTKDPGAAQLALELTGGRYDALAAWGKRYGVRNPLQSWHQLRRAVDKEKPKAKRVGSCGRASRHKEEPQPQLQPGDVVTIDVDGRRYTGVFEGKEAAE